MHLKINNLNYDIMRQNLIKNDKYSNKLSQLKNITAGVAAAATMNAAQPAIAQNTTNPPQQKIAQTLQPEVPSKQDILKAIAMVESNDGQNLNHRVISSGIHAGKHSSSKYGIMPIVARETIKQHKDLKQKYEHLLGLRGDAFHEAYHQHPELDDVLASRHYDRLSRHFGNNTDQIGHAWLNGITGTKKAIKKGSNLKNHWHVQKIQNTLNSFKGSNK